MESPTTGYAAVLKKAYKHDDFWRKLIAKPEKALDECGIELTQGERGILLAQLDSFKLVLSFDKYRVLKPNMPKTLSLTSDDEEYPTDPETGWDCTRVPWGQT
jgi:hypothetical protein